MSDSLREELQLRVASFLGTGKSSPNFDEWHNLAGPYDLVRRAVFESVAETEPESPVLDDVWQSITRAPDVTQRHIRGAYRTSGVSIDDERLYKNLCGLLASGQAAKLSQHLDATAEARTRFVLWCNRAVKYTAPDSGQWSDCANDGDLAQPGTLLQDIARQLESVGLSGEAFRHWTTYWFRRQDERCHHQLRIPFGLYKGSSAFIAHFRIRLLKRFPQSLFEDPDTALRPLGKDFVETIRLHSRRCRGAVCYSIHTNYPELPIVGDSVGGAAAVGFELLESLRPYDSDCIVVAGASADGELYSVGEEASKLDAAAAAGIRRAVVANNSELTLTKRAELEKSGLRVFLGAELPLDIASGVIAEVRQYCESLISVVDYEAKQGPYLDGRSLLDVYIEPDVLSSQPVADGNPIRSVKDMESVAIPADVRDLGEAYDRRETQGARRESWKAECDESGPRRWSVILGSPGQGKTQLIKMTLRRLAVEGRDQIDQQRVPLSSLRLPVRLSCKHLLRFVATDPGPVELLRNAVQYELRRIGCPHLAIDYILEHLSEARMWFFIDALDEVSSDRLIELQDCFRVLANWQCRVTLTSRPYAYAQWSAPVKRITEYRLAPLSDLQIREFLSKWCSDERARFRMEGLIDRALSVKSLCQNPFLLTLLCGVQAKEEINEEITRTELYEKTMWRLIGPERALDWRPMLEELAWTAFECDPRQAQLPQDRMMKLLRTSQNAPEPVLQHNSNSDDSRAPLAQNWSAQEKATLRRKELVARGVLVPSGAEGRFAFPHRSFVEYLAACALADRDGDDVVALASRKVWDPAWEQVLVFLFGRLSHTPGLLTQLLATLCDENSDDMFRHRLAVAATGLGEIRPPQREAVRREINRVTDEVWKLWWEHHRKDTVGAVDHLTRTLGVLASVGGNVEGISLVSWLGAKLRDRRPATRIRAAWALGQLGPPAVRMLDGFAPLISDTDRNVRSRSLRIVAQLGSTAAPLIDHIKALLSSKDPDIRLRGAAAFGHLRIFTDPLIDAFLPLLDDSAADVRIEAWESVSRMGALAAPLVRYLPAILDHPQPDWRGRAVSVLGSLGPVAAPFMDSLASLLDDPNPLVRFQAVGAAGRLKRLPPVVVAALMRRLKDEEPFVRACAVRSVGQMESFAEPLVNELRPLLTDPNVDVRNQVVEAIRWLGSVASPLYDAFLPMLTCSDPEIRLFGSWAIGRLGSEAGFMVSSLAPLLRDANPGVRAQAAESAGKIGSAAASLQEYFPDLLRDCDHAVRSSAIGAIGCCGPVSDAVISYLPKLLDADAPDIRSQAARSVGRVGGAAAPVFRDLVPLCRDVDAQVRVSVAWAIGRPGLQNPALLEALMPLLDDFHADVRSQAAESVGHLREDSKPMLGSLIRLLRDAEGLVRISASEAVRELTHSGVRCFCDQPGDRQALGAAAIRGELVSNLAAGKTRML